ncbi:MAG: coenzyme F420-0:L-glutamate ligase [Actinomycetota bacterium]|nr:coenzyme F420-0:L-glutamate ligase [Actinomycetota bacterium]
MAELRVFPIVGIGEVLAGDDIAHFIYDALAEPLHERDVVVVTQKIVSKAEGRLAPAAERDALVASESVRVLRRRGQLVISETRHGFVCANAGIDRSNVPGDQAALLPLDPDLSARRIRTRLMRLSGVDVGVIVSDTFGRAWRNGQTDVAIGVAGFDPFVDYRGTTDAFGNELHATRICVADELAGAAEIVMGKASGTCAAVVRGAGVATAAGAARAIVRLPADDLFR